MDIDRIARLMVQKNVDPHWYIRRYLEAIESEDGLICEGWLGNFFKRIGNAWSSFWKDPNANDQVLNRLEDAKKALTDLMQMVQANQGAEPTQMATVLRGLEQSLALLGKVEPTIKQYEPRIAAQHQAQKAGSPIPSFSDDPTHQLPPDQHAQFMSIMSQRDQIIKMADSDAKLQRLDANGDQYLQFRNQLEDYYQTFAAKTPEEQQQKEQIKNWLTQIDNDTAFREINNLIDVAKRRTRSSDLAVQRPAGHGKVVLAWRNIAAKTKDPNQQKQEMLQWYQALPPTDDVRQFVQKELQENPHLGNELELFWKYSQEWINKLPHFLAR